MRPSPQPVGRLAPTPSGDLHLGNVVAFAAAWLSIRSRGGRLLLRIEDVDRGRARPEVLARQLRDLEWLGLHWDERVPDQSERDYAPWAAALPGTYHCTCTRKQVAAAGGVYPGTCRHAGHHDGALRWTVPPGDVVFADRVHGPWRGRAEVFGDPVLRRRDGVWAYPLAVVADDLADGVTEVARGADLLEVTPRQIRLWEAFGATPPAFLHAPLVLGPDGRKLSKSHGDAHVGPLRDAGFTPTDVWRAVLPWLGLDGHEELASAVSAFQANRVLRGPVRLSADPLAQPSSPSLPAVFGGPAGGSS